MNRSKPDMMRMGDGDCQRIGRVGPCEFYARQQDTQHGLHLLFFRFAGANNGFFHKPCGIFGNGRAVARRPQQHHAARLAKLQRRLRVFINEHLFNGREIGAEMIEYHAQFFVQKHEAVRQRQLGVGHDFAIVDMRKAIAFLADNAPAGGAKARVKPKDEHPSFAITSSDTS